MGPTGGLQVTTLLGSIEENGKIPQLTPKELEALREEVSMQGASVKQAKTVRRWPPPHPHTLFRGGRLCQCVPDLPRLNAFRM